MLCVASFRACNSCSHYGGGERGAGLVNFDEGTFGPDSGRLG